MADWQRITGNGADFEFKALQVGTFENVVYLVRDPDTKEGFVIDAGWEPDTIAKEVGDTKVTAILITHGHNDHHDELDALKQKLGVPSAIGELDQDLLALAAGPAAGGSPGATVREERAAGDPHARPHARQHLLHGGQPAL